MASPQPAEILKFFCQESLEPPGKPSVETSRGLAFAQDHCACLEAIFFLRLACYYYHFVPNYSAHAAPLNSLTRKEVPFLWGKEQQEVIERLKSALATYPCLGTIKHHGLLVVDACDVAIGAVLHQVQDGTERVIGYYSKSLNSAQRNYCTIKKELLAIVATFNQWDVYLSCVSEPFVLCTDHATLT